MGVIEGQIITGLRFPHADPADPADPASSHREKWSPGAISGLLVPLRPVVQTCESHDVASTITTQTWVLDINLHQLECHRKRGFPWFSVGSTWTCSLLRILKSGSEASEVFGL